MQYIVSANEFRPSRANHLHANAAIVLIMSLECLVNVKTLPLHGSNILRTFCVSWEDPEHVDGQLAVQFVLK